ncbi:MAG: ATP-dependent helicase [Candidatus Methanoperedens sp.]|nr:ATP-dependent helicase [Candidatus Methanoperedens sp.]
MIDLSQKEAIFLPINISAFITAPPGFGKTFVMTKRVEYLISSEYLKPPNKLLALTFSNAAANEMKGRIKKNVPNSEKYIDIMNFHTLAYSILRIYGNYIDINRHFTIITEKHKDDYIYSYYGSNLGILYMLWDNKSKFSNDYKEWYNRKYLQGKRINCINSGKEDIFEELRKQINQNFINKDRLDFDHLLFKVIELFKKNPNIKNLFFKKYILLFADEFQDTNYIQYLLFKEIATNLEGAKRNVFVMGDKKQAIMRFQGANPDNIDSLIKDFNCKTLELKENHRTNSEEIKLVTRKLREPTLSVSGIEHKLYINATVEEEISRLIEVIRDLLTKNVKPHDICILFPQIKTSNPIKKRFDEESIDYILINNFKIDSIIDEYSKMTKEIEEYIEKKYTKKSVKIIIHELIKKYYSDQYSKNIVLMTIERFSKAFDGGNFSSMEVWKRLQEFYNYLHMEIDWTNLVKSNIKDRIYLSSIHGSKGLEFDYILMLGIINYRLPYYTFCFPCNDFRNPTKVDISESKDLFYVGISRAIKDIIFFYSEQDEQDLSKANRKISCVFNDIVEHLKFIDYESNEYNFQNSEIERLLCK